MIKVDKDVPIPEARKGGKYPWSDMSVGDSFYVDGKENVHSVRSAACHANKRYAPQKFLSQQEGNGIRVWRTE